MKVVILAGGMGTRFGEETQLKPKPMIEIGGRPILWHIMKWYASFGYKEFIVCCGYMGHIIKDYFINYSAYAGDSSYDLKTGKRDISMKEKEDWKVTLADTGLMTKTAGRILKIREYVNGEPFMLTYGDGVADIDIDRLMACHKECGRIATITTTQPEGRFGAVQTDEKGLVLNFKEKARKDQVWVNAGFMVMEPEIFEYLGDGSEMLEDMPFEKLAKDGQMDTYRHGGFWSPMDMMKDKEHLESLWESGRAPWSR